METLLIEQWLGGLDAVEMLDEASLTLARDAIRALPVPSDVIDRALLVVSELGRNQLRHARRGHVASRRIERAGRAGVEIIAADAGAGIDDIDAAFVERGRGSGSLGVGIGSVKRLSSELDIDVRLGEGSCLRARLFEAGFPRGREVGIYGRALPGERRSGDHAAVVRAEDGAFVMVCDGLGHGPGAREAADAAVGVFYMKAAEAPAVVIEETHRRISETRGAVMAAARIDGDAIELASAGNIEAMVTAFRKTKRFSGTAATVGGRGGAFRSRTERATLAADDVFVLMTDGIVTKASIEADGGLLRAHPAVIAQRILERFARPNDDALVLVVR